MRLIRGNLASLAVPASTVREMDRVSINEYGLPGALLMESAGSAAAQVALEMFVPATSVLIFAGAGNNAGDGFVMARLLANLDIAVHVVLAVPEESYKGDAMLNLAILQKMGVSRQLWDGPQGARLSQAGIIVDALLGTGLSGPLRSPYPDMIAFLNASGAAVLAVDIPSGLDSDTGDVHTAAVKADKTVTFALPKKGLFCGQGPSLAGEVILADIGMPRNVYPSDKVLSHL